MDPLLERFLIALLAGVPVFIAAVSVSNQRQQQNNRAQQIVNDMVVELRKEVGVLVEANNAALLEREKLEQEHEVTTSDLNRRITENGTALSKVEGALEQARKLADTVAQERDHLQTQLNDTNAELQNTRRVLNERLEGMQTNLNRLNDEAKIMADQYAALQDERARVEKAFQDSVDALKKQLETTEANLAEVQKQLADVKIELEQTKTERDGLKDKNAQLEHRVSELETERDGLQRQVNELRSELDELRTRAPESADKPDTLEPPTDTELPLGSE